MLENNTDRLFWTITSVIVTCLVLTVAVKLFPQQARVIRGAIVYSVNNTHDHKTVKDPHYEKVHKQIVANQKDNDEDSNFNFSYDQSSNSATVTGYKSLPDSHKIVIPRYIKHNGQQYQIIAIAPNSFNHTNLTSVTFPEGLQTIGQNAFANSKLQNVVFPKTLNDIQSYAFDSNQLASINLPARDDLHIESNAFTNNLIKFVNLPNKNNIDLGAFDNGTSIVYSAVSNSNPSNEANFNDYRDTSFYKLSGGANSKLSINVPTHQIIDNTGVLMRNTLVKDDDDNLYYLDNNSIPMIGIQTINNNTYYFSSDGSNVRHQVVNNNGNQMYFDRKGLLVKNKQNITYQGITYNADGNGYLSIVNNKK